MTSCVPKCTCAFNYFLVVSLHLYVRTRVPVQSSTGGGGGKESQSAYAHTCASKRSLFCQIYL